MAEYFLYGGFVVVFYTAIIYSVLYVMARLLKFKVGNIEKLFLIFPLLWFLYIWINFSWGVNIYTGNSATVHSMLSNLLFFGTPTYFIIGSIYTYARKLWAYFSAYMLLGGGLVLTWFIKAFF
uniref:hypothetical protein n=1 Tax=Halomonas sp. TaxID=1486246 RepID=UPI0026090C32|nr:hypothetical protein [Halomonas sp.]